MTAIPGLHHVTAISGPPQANLDFYTGALRQRLVKRTVNFDDPHTYHLYYGDAEGSPGTILTFFPFVDAQPGRAGPGMASAVAYVVPKGGIEAWREALGGHGIAVGPAEERFGEAVAALRDPDGLRLELVEAASGPTDGPAEEGFHSVTLWLSDPDPTARLLTEVMGYAFEADEESAGGRRMRLRAPGQARGRVIDLWRAQRAERRRQGAGTVHHVAFRAQTPEIQRDWRERVAQAGHDVTPVIDRQYFEAIYFREPGGVLFEIATDPPGFAVDEAPEALGRSLKLPERHEGRRAEIERALPPIEVRG